MPPSPLRIPSDSKLPESADVVIIGGGIVGVSAAYSLAQSGISVALIEKGHISCEQSSRNWGWCRQQNRDARELPLSGVAMRLWDEMTETIGKDLGFRRCGLIYTTADEKQLADWEAWRKVAAEFDVDTRMLSAKEAAEKGGDGRKWLGGVHSVNDGKAEPTLAPSLIAEGARSAGATLHQDCAARGLEMANGAVTAVVTEKGTIKTQSVVVAAGAWASRFLRQYGVSMPQASVRQTTIAVGPGADIGDAVYNPMCAVTKRLDGSYTLAISGKALLEVTPQGIRYARDFMPMFLKQIKAVGFGLGSSFFNGPEALGGWSVDDVSPFEKMRVADPKPLAKTVRMIKSHVDELFPALAGQPITDSWGAYIDSTPDAVPVISPTDGCQGVVVAAGCSGHGFGLGPGIGQLAAELATNSAPCVDPHPFRLSRFFDRTKIDVGDF